MKLHRITIAIVALSAALLTFSACSKDPKGEGKGEKEKSLKVYTCGHYFLDGKYRACYWIDGKKYELTDKDGRWTTAQNMTVDSDGNVYVCGYAGSIKQAVYWKNGKEIFLGEDDNNGMANQIILEDGKVIICGREGEYAYLWVDGKGIQITDKKGTLAYSVVKCPDGYYIAGQAVENNSSDPKPVLNIWEMDDLDSKPVLLINSGPIAEKLVCHNNGQYALVNVEGKRQVYDMFAAKQIDNNRVFNLNDFCFSADDQLITCGGAPHNDGAVLVVGEEINYSYQTTEAYGAFTRVTTYGDSIYVCGVQDNQEGKRRSYYWGPDKLFVALECPEGADFCEPTGIVVEVH